VLIGPKNVIIKQRGHATFRNLICIRKDLMYVKTSPERDKIIQSENSTFPTFTIQNYLTSQIQTNIMQLVLENHVSYQVDTT